MSLSPVRIAIPRDGKKVLEAVVPVWAEGGLAVTRTWGDPRIAWTVTHVASGYAVMTNIRTLGRAKVAARLFLEIGDWTVSRSRLSTAMKRAAVAVRHQLREERVNP